MSFAPFRRLRTASRFFWPSAEERRYARLLRDNPHFDRSFYVSSNPRMRRVFRLSPERHYVLFGEALGLSPNPHFSPRAYLFHNPDLAGARPLLHYIESGQREARRVFWPEGQNTRPDLHLPDLRVPAPPDPAARVAVVLHLYYHDMWPEFRAALQRQDFAFDLMVTLTGTEAGTAALKQEILSEFSAARVWAMPNHGRDIFPFIHLLNAGLLDPYEAICKLHSKKSPHRTDGDDWRQSLTTGTLGDPLRTRHRLEAFLADPQAAFWVADGHHYCGEDWWGPNRTRAADLLARAGVSLQDQPLSFPAGSIYWVKPALLARIREMDLGATDFEPEQALVDGTTAHALERAFGLLAAASGLTVREAGDLLETAGSQSGSIRA